MKSQTTTSDAAALSAAVIEEESESEEQLEEEEEEEDDSSTSESDQSSLSWISWYCSLPGHEYFAEVAEDFIEDDFNLTGLNALVPFYREALDMVLDVEPEEESLKIPDVSIVESSAELLYGLIHQRYIITRQGLQQMVSKYEASHFGSCPRVFCSGARVLPCGRSDLPGVDTVKLFCPSCIDTYTPPSSRFGSVDGSFFGTTFPHLLFQSYKELIPVPSSPVDPTPLPTSSRASSVGGYEPGDINNPIPLVPSQTSVRGHLPRLSNKIYVPKIYGFKVSERARSGPRMHWLRARPKDGETEIRQVDFYGRWKQRRPSYEEDRNGETADEADAKDQEDMLEE